jgi:hypothetical protein
MNLADILSQGESEIVEFKASFNDEALETIGAFASLLPLFGSMAGFQTEIIAS